MNSAPACAPTVRRMCLSEPLPRLVLITRPEPAASQTASVLQARGYQTLVCPMLEIQPALPLPPAPFQAILVTSGNALPALSRFDLSTRILTVGDATAARAVKAGFRHVLSAGRDAGALAELAAAELLPADGPLLLASGAGQGLDLAADLQARGFTLRRRIAYRRVAAESLSEEVRAALDAGRVGHAIFFSADTARAFIRCIENPATALAGVEALAISSQTELALRNVAWRAIRVAKHPNQDELVALLP